MFREKLSWEADLNLATPTRFPEVRHAYLKVGKERDFACYIFNTVCSLAL